MRNNIRRRSIDVSASNTFECKVDNSVPYEMRHEWLHKSCYGGFFIHDAAQKKSYVKLLEHAALIRSNSQNNGTDIDA